MSADIYLVSDGCCGGHDHNITHNVGPMLREAGLDWRDYRDFERTAAQLLEDVARAHMNLIDQPDRFRPMSAENGWGTYDQVLPFLARLAADCIKHPNAIVQVSL